MMKDCVKYLCEKHMKGREDEPGVRVANNAPCEMCDDELEGESV